MKHVYINCDEEADFERTRKDLAFILAYCERFGAEVVDVSANSDFVNGLWVKENYYYFGDGLGSYTLSGVVSSLKD